MRRGANVIPRFLWLASGDVAVEKATRAVVAIRRSDGGTPDTAVVLLGISTSGKGHLRLAQSRATCWTTHRFSVASGLQSGPDRTGCPVCAACAACALYPDRARTVVLMRAMTTSEAALALGLSPDKLRRWVREGRFADVAGVEWDKSAGFKRQRLYTRQWVLMVAKQLGITAEFSQIPGLE